LKNRRSKDNEISRKVWKAVETKSKEVRVVKAKEERDRERKRKEIREKML